jgi:hypothetical protein
MQSTLCHSGLPLAIAYRPSSPDSTLSASPEVWMAGMCQVDGLWGCDLNIASCLGGTRQNRRFSLVIVREESDAQIMGTF